MEERSKEEGENAVRFVGEVEKVVYAVAGVGKASHAVAMVNMQRDESVLLGSYGL